MFKKCTCCCNEYQGELIFLHKVKDGAVDDSYGIQVAKLADLPNEVIDRAQVILNAFEQKPSYQLSHENTDDQQTVPSYNDFGRTEEEQSVIETHTSNHNYEQATFDLFDGYNQQSEVECQIRELNLSNMTPLEALIKLNELQSQLK